MIQLARRMARHAFGIGMAIGTILVPTVATAQPQATGVNVNPGGVLPAPQPCPEAFVLDNPFGHEAAEWCEFVAFTREVWHQIIGGDSDAPIAYRTSEPITGNGAYSAFDADGVGITVRVLANVNDDPNVVFGSPDSSGILFAMLEGPNGTVGVEAVVNTVVIDSGELLSHVTPVAYMFPEMEEWLLAGGGFEALSLSGCLAVAAAVFAAAMALCAAAYAACHAAARAAYNALMRTCVVRSIFIPKIGLGLALLCVIAASAAYAAARKGCRAAFQMCTRAAARDAYLVFVGCMAAKMVTASQVGRQAVAEH